MEKFNIVSFVTFHIISFIIFAKIYKYLPRKYTMLSVKSSFDTSDFANIWINSNDGSILDSSIVIIYKITLYLNRDFFTDQYLKEY